MTKTTSSQGEGEGDTKQEPEDKMPRTKKNTATRKANAPTRNQLQGEEAELELIKRHPQGEHIADKEADKEVDKEAERLAKNAREQEHHPKMPKEQKSAQPSR